jgi:hypothetical protein
VTLFKSLPQFFNITLNFFFYKTFPMTHTSQKSCIWTVYIIQYTFVAQNVYCCQWHSILHFLLC